MTPSPSFARRKPSGGGPSAGRAKYLRGNCGSKQNAIHRGSGAYRGRQTPIVCSERVVAPKQVVAAYSQKHSDVLCAATIETAYPLFVASIGSPSGREPIVEIQRSPLC